MFYNKCNYSIFLMLSIFFLSVFSSNASASTENLCGDIAGQYTSAYPEERMITRGSNISFAKHLNKSDVYCEVQCHNKSEWGMCASFYNEFGQEYAAFHWRYTGNDYVFSNLVRSIIFNDKKAGEQYRLYAKTDEELCSKIADKAKRGSISANSSGVYSSIYVSSGPYYIDKSVEATKTTTGLSCKFEFAGTDANEGKIIQRDTVFYGYLVSESEPAEIAQKSCRAGEVFNEDKQMCEFPEPQASESCKADVIVTQTILMTSVSGLLNINGCEAKYTGEPEIYKSIDNQKCVRMQFKLTGNGALSYMYTLRDSDMCEAEEMAVCENDAVLNKEYNVCVKPELEDGEKSESLEDPDNYENTNPDDLMNGNLGEGEYVQCDEYPKLEGMQKETICNVYSENGEYKRPALVIEYPDGVYNPNICANGYTGNNCDKDPNAGGSIDAGNSSVLSGVNDIENLLKGNGVYNIDYNSIGEDPFSEGEEGEGESIIDIGESLTNHDKILSESGTCPAPKEIVLFENVVFAGKHIEKKFEFSYELFCDFSSKYKDIYIALFIMMLSIDFIRRVRR